MVSARKSQSLFPEPESTRELPRKSNGKQNLWVRKDKDPKHHSHAGKGLRSRLEGLTDPYL